MSRRQLDHPDIYLKPESYANLSISDVMKIELQSTVTCTVQAEVENDDRDKCV